MSQTGNWGLVVLLVFATLSYAYVTVKAAPIHPQLQHPQSQHTDNNNRRLRVKLDAKPPLPPLAPMWWDPAEGAYMVVLVVGAGVVELVLDTGSSQLSVKGTGCEWRTCTPLGCAVTSCPCGLGADGTPRTDCTEHYYQPLGHRLAPGEQGAGTSTQMTYGSQTDTVSHYLDTVHVPMPSSSILTCDMLHTAPSPVALRDVAGNENEWLRVGKLVVHRVSYIEGTSSSNLLGLARPNGGTTEHGANVVLDELLDPVKRTWSAVLQPTGGWLALGTLPCFTTPHYIPLLTPRPFANFLTSFYIVNLVSMSVGPSPDALTRLRDVPKYCVIDTGTTATYGSTQLGDALDAAGYVENRSVVQLKLGSASSPLTLTYTPDQLRDPDYPTQGIIEAWPGRTLDDYSQIFPDRDGGVLLLGAVMMYGFYWEFDLRRARVGVTDLRV